MRDGAPVGMELDRRDHEHEQAQPAVAEDALDPPERHQPEHEREPRRPRARAAARYESPTSSCSAIAMPPISAASVSRLTSCAADQRDEPDREAEPLAHDVEDGLLRDGRDPAAHLGVDDDPADAEHDRPEQLVAERRAGGELKTMSPMSTKPPIAARMPSAIEKTLFIRELVRGASPRARGRASSRAARARRPGGRRARERARRRRPASAAEPAVLGRVRDLRREVAQRRACTRVNVSRRRALGRVVREQRSLGGDRVDVLGLLRAPAVLPQPASTTTTKASSTRTPKYSRPVQKPNASVRKVT